jgi:hypothetical protein
MVAPLPIEFCSRDYSGNWFEDILDGAAGKRSFGTWPNGLNYRMISLCPPVFPVVREVFWKKVGEEIKSTS